jgi:hypothetical protein
MPYFGVPIRNGLPIGLGSQAGFGIAPFDPRDLFSAGEQGAWYDPSDFSTLFTDSAGTTPVTGVEQFVGLMLDKSKGAPTTLGAELWSGFGTINSPWTNAGGGVFTIDGSQVASRDLSQTPQYAIGKFYVTQFTLSGVTGGTVQIFAGEGIVGPSLGNGTYTYRQSASQTYLIFRAPAGVAATVSKVSVRELPGNHATSTGTKRPKLAARYNLLTYSEQFDDAAWTKSNVTVTANAAAAPNGTTTADKVVPSTGSVVQQLIQALTVGAVAYTQSIYAKVGAYQFIQFNNSQSGTEFANFDVSAGTIGTVGGAAVATIENVGNGWYRCSITYSAFTAGTVNFRWQVVGSATATRAQSFAGDGINGVLVWGADLRPTSQATGLIGPTYQRVAAATDYDTVGFLPYLAFDGVDDSMSTGSIDFTATDKMTVFAGVRKLSDAATSFIAEFSSAWDGGNNGTFAIGLISSSSNYFTALNGTSAAYYTETTFGAPITNVLTSSYNIAGASIASEIIPRVNGSTPTLAAVGTTSGTGNFGNYPLFICARNNASLYFNGWLSSLIIRGAQSTDSQISATESWVNGRTGAY